ncbi:protein UXT isoform X1 [Xiphophorus hellerii]|uniref:protein UXT isoform X1 n=2 Tax=Xiphophorus hellerii TaxID=8084 RepID=UPI0013B36999|nr:protein UXT isoform X1 [Xiphophorus hellerii]
MMARPAGSAGGLDQKVLQYEAFINDVLRRDLRAVLEQRDRLYEKMSHYLQLKNAIQSLEEAGPQRLKADVDLGCSFFVQARVDNPSRILVLVGFGFFVEMSHQEALHFIDKKTNQLTLVCGSCRGWRSFQTSAGSLLLLLSSDWTMRRKKRRSLFIRRQMISNWTHSGTNFFLDVNGNIDDIYFLLLLKQKVLHITETFQNKMSGSGFVW